MLTFETAREIALSHIQKINDSHIDYDPVYIAYLRRNDPTYTQEKTIAILTGNQEESFGWIFFYQSKKFIETGNFSYALGGNSPFIINKETGELWETGTAHPIEYYIEKYKAKTLRKLYIINATTRIVFDGWENGFLKVSSTKLFQEHFGINLKEAKEKTDGLLEGKVFSLSTDNLKNAQLTLDSFLKIGVLCHFE